MILHYNKQRHYGVLYLSMQTVKKRVEEHFNFFFRSLHYEHNEKNCMETHLSLKQLGFYYKAFWDLLKRTNDYLLFSTFDVKYP